MTTIAHSFEFIMSNTPEYQRFRRDYQAPRPAGRKAGMNQAKLNEMVEQATPKERRQFKQWINWYLGDILEANERKGDKAK